MANTFQQEAQRRKLIYIAAIVVLFTASWAFRRYSLDKQADALAIREQSRGEVELTGSIVRLGLTGSRGLATCFLWNEAIDKQRKNQWNELEVRVRALTKLQPHFITPWLFQSWNLAYNVSVEADRARDKYFYISRGIELLAEGERQNTYHPDLRWNIGFYTEHKIGKSDETNILRSLFQLSLIAPNDRDPARFYTQTAGGPQFNWAELEKFCQQHPQLVRRLREGIHRDTAREKSRLFRCETPQELVQFLQDNYNLPSVYEVPPLTGAITRVWDPAKGDTKAAPEAQFPQLPAPHTPAFDERALSHNMQLGDDIDPFLIAHAWYAYAQEPLPPPSPTLPGNSEDITDRARQRRPRNMTTLIFRNHPAQALRFSAERLQAEGWYDKEQYDISDWFESADDANFAGRQVRIGGERDWSEVAWNNAKLAWEKHGRENLILLSAQDEANKHQLAERYAKRYENAPSGAPTNPGPDVLGNPEIREEYEAGRFLFEYNFYRNVSNFPHHYARAVAESRPETVACRKYFFKAEQAYMRGERAEALELYTTPIKHPAWDPRALSPLEAWRDEVLLKNRDYRRDAFTQETTAEYQVRFLRVFNAERGNRMKKQVGALAAALPLVPRFGFDLPRAPIVQGPFEVRDGDGLPLIPDHVMDQVLDRLQMPRRRQAPAAVLREGEGAPALPSRGAPPPQKIGE